MSFGAIFMSRGYVSLDSLRGLAAWSVTLPHFFLFSGVQSAALEFGTIFAVEVFFILSGFVLGGQLDLCAERRDYRTLRTFYLRRWYRTLPVYFVVLLLLSALNGNLLTLRFFEYSTFTATWLSIPAANEYFVPAWSLGVEEWFYFLFPPALILVLRLGVRRHVGLLALFALFAALKVPVVLDDPDHVESLRRITLVRLDSICVGYVVHLLVRHYSDRLLGRRVTLCLLAGLLTFTSFFAYSVQVPMLFIYGSNAAAAAIVLSFLAWERHFARSALVSRFSAFAAHTSYSTYLCHLLLFQIIAAFALPGVMLQLCLYIVGVVGFSVLSFYLLERPFLGIRPRYDSVTVPDSGWRFRDAVPMKVLTNAAAFAALLIFVEYGARGVVELYQHTYVAGQVAEQVADASVDAGHTKPKLTEAFGRDRARRDAMPGSPYRYSSYSVFENRPFSSETINVNGAGYRVTPEPTPAGRPPLRVWVFGASPIFGATNADDWTIPTRMQTHLQQALPGRAVTVSNMGVVGYSSWQTLIAFQKTVAVNDAPDAVLVFATHNDHLNAWHDPKDDCSHLMNTGVGSTSILARSWDNLSRGRYIFADDIIRSAKDRFPGFLEVARVFWKVPSAAGNYLSPKARIASYREKAHRYNDRVARCLPQFATHFQTNMALMSKLASMRGAQFFAGTLPELSTTGKELVSHELIEKYTKEKYFYALTDEELGALDRLPSTRLSQTDFVDRDSYLRSFRNTEAVLSELLEQYQAHPIALREFTDALVDVHLFSTSIHFTHEGADFLAQEISRQMLVAWQPE
jgi:peptidoglycan/LPS O-acetylase OafA/YrhL